MPDIIFTIIGSLLIICNFILIFVLLEDSYNSSLYTKIFPVLLKITLIVFLISLPITIFLNYIKE